MLKVVFGNWEGGLGGEYQVLESELDDEGEDQCVLADRRHPE